MFHRFDTDFSLDCFPLFFGSKSARKASQRAYTHRVGIRLLNSFNQNKALSAIISTTVGLAINRRNKRVEPRRQAMVVPAFSVERTVGRYSDVKYSGCFDRAD